jgi:hypothetical protein
MPFEKSQRKYSCFLSLENGIRKQDLGTGCVSLK